MPRRDFVPDEKRSLRIIFFVSSMILVGTTVWALWDEAVLRRPWITYQVAFKHLEIDRVQRALDDARARLEQPETQATLAQLREELRWAEEARKGPDYQAAVREVARLRVAFQDVNQDLRFTRSELDEAYYWYNKARHEGKDYSAELAVVRRLQERERLLDPKVAAAQQALDEARERVRRFDRTVQEIEDRIGAITAEVDGLVRQQEAIRRRPLELQQVVVEGLDKNEFDVFILRVDRCQTCHLGIDRPGFEDLPPADKVFETHPNREAILGNHEVSRFGCTVCHEGQGTALDHYRMVEGRIPDAPHGLGREYGGSPNVLWDFPLLRGGLVQASCRKCHLERAEFTTAVKKGEEPDVIAEWVDMGPNLAKGLAMFEVLGCHGCHPAEGFNDLPRVGPELTRIATKVEPAWMVEWIQNPQGYLRHTRMPNFGLSREEATAIAAYLLDRSEPDPPVAGRFDPRASPEKGKELFETVGCLACHTMRAVFEERVPRTFSRVVGRDFAPDLSQAAVKIKDPEWLFRWLKNPKAIRPHSAMPSLRLTDAEASALVAFLMTRGERQRTPSGLLDALRKPEQIEEGRRLIQLRGCFGCHEIRGFETAQRIAPDLSNFGHKRLLQLSFGDAVHVKHTWEDWIFWKLKEPTIYATERERLLMPNFGLSDEEIRALRVLVKGFSETEVPEHYREEETVARKAIARGQRLVRGYNCVGCHVIEGKGGDVAAWYEGRENQAPPPLALIEGILSQGEKAQANWVFEFLHRPTPIRPWLQIRMPTFGLSDTEAGGLTNYFVALAGLRVPFEFVPPPAELDPKRVEAGRMLASPAYFSCGSCHVEGDKKPEGPPEGWAPDLALAPRRLRPEWIVTWLKDPQRVQPGTRMPSFFADEFSGPDEILDGDEGRQILALRDYILSLRKR